MAMQMESYVHGHRMKMAVGVLILGLLMKYGVPGVTGPMSLQDGLITVGVLGLVVWSIKHSKCCMAMMKKR